MRQRGGQGGPRALQCDAESNSQAVKEGQQGEAAGPWWGKEDWEEREGAKVGDSTPHWIKLRAGEGEGPSHQMVPCSKQCGATGQQAGTGRQPRVGMARTDRERRAKAEKRGQLGAG
jgi:hypothetical protein